MITIWIDADSCPRLVQEQAIKTSKENHFKLIFVANHEIRKKSEDYEMIICGNEKDSADNYIFDSCTDNDLVITRDILFAARLVEKGITVINDRGTSFTKYNIEDKLRERNLDFNLAQLGFSGGKERNYGQKEFTKFEKCFQQEIHKLLTR